ncbi:hypothetical protein P2318_14200 [Myxococcaceae bacterium GXIMD 01537]
MRTGLHRSLTLAGALVLSGCTTPGAPGGGTNIVRGALTPAHFRFTTVTPLESQQEPGGWRAVCIHAVMNNANTGDTTLCKFEVGVPLRTHLQGEVLLVAAQRACAEQANTAARHVLSMAGPGAPTAVLCKQFKVEYEALLKRVLAGARVSDCRLAGIETVLFNVPPLDVLSPP